MLKSLLAWFAPKAAAEAERVTYQALAEGSGRGIIRWANELAGQLGCEPPALAAIAAPPEGDDEEDENQDTGGEARARTKRKPK